MVERVELEMQRYIVTFAGIVRDLSTNADVELDEPTLERIAADCFRCSEAVNQQIDNLDIPQVDEAQVRQAEQAYLEARSRFENVQVRYEKLQKTLCDLISNNSKGLLS